MFDEYLMILGCWLVVNVNDVCFFFLFFWINNLEINVFVFYGGYVGVYIGFIV